MTMRTLLGIIFFFVFVGENISGYAEESLIEDAKKISEKIKNEQKNLNVIQNELKQNRINFDSAEKREISLLGELESIDKTKHAKRKELRLLIEKVGQVNEDTIRVDEEIDVMSGDVGKKKDLLRTRLRGHYKSTQGDTDVPLFASQQNDEVHLRDLIFSSMLNAEHDRVLKNVKELVELEKERHSFDNKASRLLHKQQAVERTLSAIKHEQKKKHRVLARARDEQTAYERTIVELEQSSKKIEALIYELLERQEKLSLLRNAGDGLTASKGTLYWPSEGKVVGFFGNQKHPKFDTFLKRKGIDIEAAEGSVIRAAFPGIIVFSDWLKGYGLLLIIDHGLGDVSLYAHASALLVNVGDRVKAGQPVGTVGDTGLTGDSMLYFEIRAGGKAVDPVQWLSARK